MAELLKTVTENIFKTLFDEHSHKKELNYKARECINGCYRPL